MISLNQLQQKSFETGVFSKYVRDFKLTPSIKGKYIYNSVRIEGNSFSEKDTIALIKNTPPSEQYSRTDTNEILDLDSAIDFLYDNLDISNLDEDFLIELHLHTVNLDERSLPGLFKLDPNYSNYNGQKFYYADPDNVVPRLRNMNGIYNQSEKRIKDIAIMIGEFVTIHPFRDGNGRVQRLLLNWSLIRNGYPPIIIEYTEKEDYIFALNEYRVSGDISEFLDFLECKLKVTYSYILEE